MQILVTALFTVTLLRRPIGMKRWVALILLTAGVATVSLPQSGTTLDDKLLFHDTSDHFFPRSVHEMGQSVTGTGEVAHHLSKRAVAAVVNGLTKRSATYEGIAEDEDTDPKMNYSIGLAAVLVAATVSALNGVYFEKVLKDSPTPVSVWTRNIQLSFYSLFPALFLGVIWKDGADIMAHGFFDGYNWIVWTAISFHATSGILTTLVINYADNIAKNFSTSFSILISVVFSLWFFEYELTSTVCVPLFIFLSCLFAFFLSFLYLLSWVCANEPLFSSSSARLSSSARRTCTPQRPAIPAPSTARRPSTSRRSRRRRSTVSGRRAWAPRRRARCTPRQLRMIRA